MHSVFACLTGSPRCHGSKKEVVKKPDVSLKIWSEAATVLQTEEEVAPFAAKAPGHIAPETLNANIMYTPAKYIRYTF
jgi:hypothetical protein